jgi:hypothetical protein
MMPAAITFAYSVTAKRPKAQTALVSVPIDTSDDAQMLVLIERSIRNQFVIYWADPMSLEAVVRRGILWT